MDAQRSAASPELFCSKRRPWRRLTIGVSGERSVAERVHCTPGLGGGLCEEAALKEPNDSLDEGVVDGGRQHAGMARDDGGVGREDLVRASVADAVEAT